MGTRNSSMTRVQPVFRQLVARDPSGTSWLPVLLALASRWPSFIAARPGWTPGRILDPKPSFEHEAATPQPYLETVLRVPQRLTWPLDRGAPKTFGAVTTANRRLLLAGDPSAQREALGKLAHCAKGQFWWIFEGVTKVDHAILAERLRLFVEGKRTETSVREPTEWDPQRLQIFRNLDCLRHEEGDQEYAVLVIVERGSPAHRDARLLDRDFDAARASWPHLTDSEAEALWDHYLGHLTWEALSDAVGGLKLPRNVAEAQALGLCD